MQIIISLITIGVALFFEGVLQKLAGVSIFTILFILQMGRQDFRSFVLTLLPVSIALDFLLFFPPGSSWVLATITYWGYRIIDKFFQGLSGIGLFINAFVAFFLNFLFRFILTIVIEKGSIIRYFSWDKFGDLLISSLFSAIIFLTLKILFDIVIKPTDTQVKLK